ncbi:MAG: TIGR03761 family integrating conjugative element protein [Lachnospiraceae bacterium]|nr:TIGR03761 family integrating conjugative element protein [Lachnospiraceae bacterium]
MEDNKIDKVIAGLSKIEASAVSIQQDAEREKAEYAKVIEEKIKEFDEQLNKETERELKELEAGIASVHQKKLSDMRTSILEDVSRLEALYNESHEQWAKDIFEQIIKE